MIFLCSCGMSKYPISSDNFISYFENTDYYVEDITSQYEGYERVNHAVIAMNINNDFQIEFFDLTSDSYAEICFNTNKEIIENQI